MPQHAKLEPITHVRTSAKFSRLQCTVNQTTLSLAHNATICHIAVYTKHNAGEQRGLKIWCMQWLYTAAQKDSHFYLPTAAY